MGFYYKKDNVENQTGIQLEKNVGGLKFGKGLEDKCSFDQEQLEITNNFDYNNRLGFLINQCKVNY